MFGSDLNGNFHNKKLSFAKLSCIQYPLTACHPRCKINVGFQASFDTFYLMSGKYLETACDVII